MTPVEVPRGGHFTVILDVVVLDFMPTPPTDGDFIRGSNRKLFEGSPPRPDKLVVSARRTDKRRKGRADGERGVNVGEGGGE